MYLQESFDAVLHTVSEFPIKSEIVFTFISRRIYCPGKKLNLLSFPKLLSEPGEPFVSLLLPTLRN